jgi:uncharacterized DUF497 family protein
VVDYTWDPDKNDANIRKRGIDFDEARTLTIGLSCRNRWLVVVTSYRDQQSPRIISAWRATKRERNAYERRRR